MTDVFAIQDENLTGYRRKAARPSVWRSSTVKHYTENLDAYNLYLKGRYHLTAGRLEGWAKIKEYFEQAIQADPGYALPCSIGGVLLEPWLPGSRPAKVTSAKCWEALSKALELDEELRSSQHDGLG